MTCVSIFGINRRTEDVSYPSQWAALGQHFPARMSLLRTGQSAREYNSGHTNKMKTAVSLPDELFHMAEAAARQLRISRSKLYAKAVAEFLKKQREDSITERLNEFYSRRTAKVYSGLHRAQLKSLEKDAW